MKIYVVGSTSFAKQMVEVRDHLRALGYDGWIHPDYEAIARGQKANISKLISDSEKAAVKRSNDYLKVHYKHICESDAILVVNFEKNGIKDYIGGNVLIEMGQAYVNDKYIFLLNAMPTDVPYISEIECMDPVCLNGNLESISEEKTVKSHAAHS